MAVQTLTNARGASSKALSARRGVLDSSTHSPRMPSISSGRRALTLRALVSSKDAGVIIGRGGARVAEIRTQASVKAGISQAVVGVPERVITVVGDVENVSHAYTLILTQLCAAQLASSETATPLQTRTSLRLLISHNHMGTIIGREGANIKAIQDTSGARMIASKKMLPQSMERIVEVQGTTDEIGRAVEEIGRCLLEDQERGLDTVLFQPGTSDHRLRNTEWSMTESSTPGTDEETPDYGFSSLSLAESTSPKDKTEPQNLRTQSISIPPDMVGCIIGRQGSKIAEIRRLSGSKISIAKASHDGTGERLFTIVGTAETNEKALFLLYTQLESEKERRVGRPK